MGSPFHPAGHRFDDNGQLSAGFAETSSRFCRLEVFLHLLFDWSESSCSLRPFHSTQLSSSPKQGRGKFLPNDSQVNLFPALQDVGKSGHALGKRRAAMLLYCFPQLVDDRLKPGKFGHEPKA